MIGYMIKNKLIDCVTFFDNNLMFDVRYNILVNQIDYFVICESRFDHKGDEKGKKFDVYNRDAGFMDWISAIIKTKFGISKKDSWNPMTAHFPSN